MKIKRKDSENLLVDEEDEEMAYQWFVEIQTCISNKVNINSVSCFSTVEETNCNVNKLG